MRTKVIAGTAVLALAVALTGCSSSSTTTTGGSTSQSAPSMASMSATTMLKGMFGGLNGKAVAGSVTVTGSTVELSGFSSDEGPDLHLYLTKGTDEAAVTAGVQLGSVAYNKASQTFTIASSASAAGYTNVVVHCDKAKAVFGAASLS